LRQKFGASPELVQQAFDAQTKEEAIGLLSGFLQDPQAKIELETALLNNLRKREQIKTIQRQRELLGEPTAAEKKKIEADIKNAEASIPIMQDKIDTVDALLDHAGLIVRVGPTFLARASRGFLGTLGRIALLPAGLISAPSLLGGTVTGISGSGQEFAGGVHQLTSGLALQSLIDAKARGATFGALSDAELRILSSSATKLSDWEIKDNGVGTGFWDIDEESFKRELRTIQDLTRRALVESEGKLFTPEEQAIFDAKKLIISPDQFF